MGKPKILVDLANVILEVLNARKGKATLVAKMDEIDVFISNKVGKTDRKSDLFNVSRDISIAGTQTITGLNAIPKRIEIRATSNDSTTLAESVGSYEVGSNNQSCIVLYKNSSSVVCSGMNATNAVAYAQNESVSTVGLIQNISSTQFDIVWTKVGSATSKTFNMQIIVYYS